MFDFPREASPRFWLDPWASDYGTSFDIDADIESTENGVEVDALVETADWSRGLPAAGAARPERIVFVDGVQRIEAWGRLAHGDRLVEAALASVAVGASVCEAAGASVQAPPPLRILAVGQSLATAPLRVPAGRMQLDFQPEPGTRAGREGVFDAIRTRRSELERTLAESLIEQDALVVIDGRLSFDPAGATPVVGFAKTIHRLYLEPPQSDLVFRLADGERTPVFRITYGDTTRYSWFLRLPFTRPVHHPLAGVVRLETPEIGREAALRLAGLTAATLPAFASRPQHDPRAPQNLLPVGGLERRLRHEMGDPQFIRRAIEDYLARPREALV